MQNLQLTPIYPGNNCTGEPIMIPVMPISPNLAEAYVPYQIYNRIFTPQEALKKGTVFPELARS